MSFGWIIEKDFTGDNDEGTMGPSRATATKQEILESGKPFRMYSDDGDLYYEGRFLMNHKCSGFEPLDNFGGPNSGCTEIRYFENGSWVTL